MSPQATFAQALLRPELPCPGALKTWNGSDPEIRFAVYRNNVTVSLVDALADTFPVVQALVGEAFFRAMARVFVQNQPPRTRLLAFYGSNFAHFVDQFAPAVSVPYLSDVARLEMARVHAYHAADIDPLGPDALQRAWADPQQLMRLQLGLHPSVQVLTSAFAIYSLWAAHQGPLCITTVDPFLRQTVLVFRQGLVVETRPLSVGVGQFIQALQRDETLVEAANAAARTDAAFDLPHALAMLIRFQLITHLTTGDRTHEHTT